MLQISFLSSDRIRQKLLLSCLVLSIVSVLILSIRSLPGNPSAETMNTPEWKEDGPFELSPERGRFALLYSIVEDHSFFFSVPVARFVTPDLAKNPDGKFVSLFAPLLSIILIPGYILGSIFGVAAAGAAFNISLFALGNAILIRSIAMRLGARNVAATLGAFAFLFGTPAFSYAVTLYQHHVSLFLLLVSMYVLLRWQGKYPLLVVALLSGISIPLDNPNFFFFLPLIVFALSREVIPRLKRNESKLESMRLEIRPARLILAAMIGMVPMGLFFWYNSVVNGGAFQLSGTLPGVPAISETGEALPFDPNQIVSGAREHVEKKTAVGFFETRNLLSGFSIHILSPDRGTIWYAPVILFGIFGIAMLYREKRSIANLFLGTILSILLLYSMWGDPWGGWAFGSRYLIPAYAILGIGIGITLSRWGRNLIVSSVFFILLFYSLGVNTLGALTSGANPPQAQVLALEQLSGKVQKYTYERNWDYLHEFGSKSFFYRSWAYQFLDAVTYYWVVVILLGIIAITLGVFFLRENRDGGVSSGLE